MVTYNVKPGIKGREKILLLLLVKTDIQTNKHRGIKVI